jgi:hypothetical protein
MLAHLKNLVENVLAKPNLRVAAMEVKDVFNGIAARIESRDSLPTTSDQLTLLLQSAAFLVASNSTQAKTDNIDVILFAGLTIARPLWHWPRRLRI